MTFTIMLHPKATKELESLDGSLRSRIKEQLRELGNDPETAGKRLKRSEFWSLRIGDYRAIYEIDPEMRQVIVLYIGHRKNVYDDFSKIF